MGRGQARTKVYNIHTLYFSLSGSTNGINLHHLQVPLRKGTTRNMSQKNKNPGVHIHVDEDNHDDDDKTIFDSHQELTYSRNTGSFIDDDSTTIDSDLHHLVAHNSSHRRSASNDRLISSHLSQWHYNSNRVGLSRGLVQVEDLLHELIRENEQRPIYVPEGTDEYSKLHILRLDFKLDGNVKNDLALDKETIAKLFQSQANAAITHIASLQKRVDDTSSKVFITGDLNAGKSTFCNALLRRKVLPEDQLPCTNVFCEILEARENDHLEEVHAIPLSVADSIKTATVKYNIHDKSTYEIHAIQQLPDLVFENDKYALLKIYIKDNQRPPESSLLRNGTVDISLIDSPGLNMDSVQTTEVMSRQEEIDLVIFVVNAENQLTLSGKEFISMASREKKLIFFVVNKFDHIRDKERCKKLILDQIKKLSPETYKQAKEFIHFVSSENKINFPDDDNGPDDDNSSPDSDDPDFDGLENSLRNFVLKKRSLSKLLPAKTYLVRLLQDIDTIATWNLNVYKEEDAGLHNELDKLQPQIQSTKQQCNKLTDSVDCLSESAVSGVYDFTKKKINSSLHLSSKDFPTYEGLASVHDYIFRARQFITEQVKNSVETSEFYAKGVTEKTVNQINTLGKSELGDEFMSDRIFQSDLMFTKRKHSLGKQLNVPFAFEDLFDPSWDGFCAYLSWGLVKPHLDEQVDEVAKEGTWASSLGLQNYSLNKYWTNPSLLFTSKIPTLAVYSWGGAKVLTNVVIYGTKFFSWQSFKKLSTSVLLIGSVLGVAYLIHDLPRALPKNLACKYTAKLQELDYAHGNAERISKEVRNVLKFPAREIVKSCELVVDKKQTVRRDLEKKLQDNAISVKFFQKLVNRACSQKNVVEQIDLDVD